MRSLSSNFEVASQQLQTSEVFLTLLDVVIHENDGTVTTKRYVNNTQDVTHNGVIYNRASFAIELGGDAADRAPQTTLQFDSGDREMIRKLREVNARPEVNLRIVLASNPDYVELGPINYEAETVQISDNLVSITLIVEPILNEPIPCDSYTPKLFSGLWTGVSVTTVPPESDRPPDQDDGSDSGGGGDSDILPPPPSDPEETISTSISATECWPGNYDPNGNWTYDQFVPSFGTTRHGILTPDRFRGAFISVISTDADSFYISISGASTGSVGGRDHFTKIVSSDGVELYTSTATFNIDYIGNASWRWEGLSVPFFSTWETSASQSFTIIKQ